MSQLTFHFPDHKLWLDINETHDVVDLFRELQNKTNLKVLQLSSAQVDRSNDDDDDDALETRFGRLKTDPFNELCEFVQATESLTSLSVFGNGFGARGVAKLVYAVMRNPRCGVLTRLNIANNLIGSDGLVSLATLLSDRDVQLCDLDASGIEKPVGNGQPERPLAALRGAAALGIALATNVRRFCVCVCVCVCVLT